MLRSFPLIFSLSVFWRSLFSPYFDSFFHVLSWSGKKATLDGIRIFSSLDGKSLTSTFSSVFGENSPKILRILHFICSSSVIMWVHTGKENLISSMAVSYHTELLVAVLINIYLMVYWICGYQESWDLTKNLGCEYHRFFVDVYGSSF
ncbi:uncharacterized protein LOC143856445 isoform X4 [Tasmannia lanceolata]|uniref:uncharacterized protein LOC143856445 isoform X4 n=1 Tax=Tasmannia lanceolata TaxID=3420 RepID=UPI004063CE5A